MNTLQLKVNLSFQELAALVKQLSPDEKLKLNDVIWEEDMDIPTQHQKLVLQRIDKARKNPNRMMNWDKES